jgi:hypothetical protein
MSPHDLPAMPQEKVMTGNVETDSPRTLKGKCLCGADHPLGTLVDSPSIRPSAHIFVGSKAPWYIITDDLPQHEEFQ